MTTRDLAAELCTRCALCCNGALFDFGPLASDEVAQARADGLTVLEAEAQFGFGLPCPALDGACCTAYTTRPGTCRAYRCQLLRAAEAGEVTVERALATIASARETAAGVIAQLPEGETITDARRRRRDAAASDGAAVMIAPPTLMMALGLLDLVLDEHFRKASERQVMPRG